MKVAVDRWAVVERPKTLQIRDKHDTLVASVNPLVADPDMVALLLASGPALLRALREVLLEPTPDRIARASQLLAKLAGVPAV